MYGFTLPEIAIVILIVGILTAIALPMYTDQVVRSRRSDAMHELMQFANRQQSFFSTNLRYATQGEMGLPRTTDFYSITLPLSTSITYSILAIPRAGRSQEANGKLRILSDGRRQWDKANNDSFGYDWDDR